MAVRSLTLTLAGVLVPAAAGAHDAFGDLGPFHAALLHPLADPGQGLILVAVGVVLARQPLATVRPAYAALALAGVLTVALGAAADIGAPGLGVVSVAAALLGVLALTGVALGPMPTVLLAAVTAVCAGLAYDLPPARLRQGALAVIGGGLGIALGALLAWGLVDLLQRRLGRVAGAVAGSWIAAVGLMAAAFALSGAA